LLGRNRRVHFQQINTDSYFDSKRFVCLLASIDCIDRTHVTNLGKAFAACESEKEMVGEFESGLDALLSYKKGSGFIKFGIFPAPNFFST